MLKIVKLLLEQFKVCIFAKIVFGVRGTLREDGKALSPRENPLKLSYTTSIVQNSQEAQEIANESGDANLAHVTIKAAVLSVTSAQD